jgi:hypothetical protein
MLQAKIDIIINDLLEKGNTIQTELKQVQKRRQVVNKINNRAYYAMVNWLGLRAKAIETVMPNQKEVAFLEVYHILVQSGWIVSFAEFKQIMTFVGI